METWKKTLVLSAACLMGGIWGSSASAGGAPPALTTITIDDSTETLTLSVNGVPVPNTCFVLSQFEQCTDQVNAPGNFFGDAVTPLNILEPGTGAFSDFISASLIPNGGIFTLVQITFRSDLDGVTCTISDCGFVGGASVTEVEGLQTFQDLKDPNGNELVIKYVSDVERAPEPATLALLGIGLAGLGFSRRKRKQ